ncbi:MAG: coproporphyrinogen dehydrogenase HemZ [Ruminococcus flavefaciens]|nr:coproporphyrinogen dehydrogenase HemZ [Ruminococcus flavefaciens]MCM1230298.1 coproporphyrinogen dehydrogenase HemZ [Ruminococcus flavefaciens]
MTDNNKMPIVLIGNSFKYETEAVCKLFFHTARFSFSDDISNAVGDNFIVADVSYGDSVIISAEVRLNGGESEKETSSLPLSAEKNDIEHELCRLIYHILCRKTGINPPWGLMTGIRPVKKVTELIQKGFSENQIEKILTERFELSPKKFSLAYQTAINQLPILESINKRAVSLYVSIPFCPTRCSYCSFVSHSMDSAIKLMPEYISALCRELEIIGQIVRDTDTEIDTIYFGGGTPTSISAQDIAKIMQTVADNFNLDKIREYSFEAGRPDTITEEKLHIIKALGADRISVNPQTLNNDVLRVIGRKHSGDDALKAFELARKAGFNNINTDLIAGLPTESAESFKNTLDRITEISPESITVHTLTVKRSADLFESGSENMSNPAGEMVDYSIEKLMSLDYLPYYMYRQKNTVDNLENVGYAKKGFESQYNIFIMDETQTILGAGCAASTKLVYPDGKISRIHNYKFPYEYIKRFDELMQKKQEVTECLRKIKSIPLK